MLTEKRLFINQWLDEKAFACYTETKPFFVVSPCQNAVKIETTKVEGGLCNGK